jgi:NTP pyrophosphatase (non-canonical NTP hydrolase)
MADDALDRLRTRLCEFAAAREWERFHSPKNLAVAISVEAGELLEQFQWLADDTDSAGLQERRVAVEHEMADVLLYLIRLADVLRVDLVGAADRKIVLNESKYPIEKSRGTAKKYSEL